MGAFGLSVPEEYGGFGEGGEGEYLGMVVATEELSPRLARHRRLADHPARDPHPGAGEGRHRGAEAGLAAASSPTAEVMAAVAVTEPDFGSDVAGIKVTATPADGPDGEAG